MSERIIKILSRMRESPGSVRFKDLCRVCEHYFGNPRQQGTSHRIFRTPWASDPRINIQDSHGMAKVYQIKQVLAAIDRLESQHEPAK